MSSYLLFDEFPSRTGKTRVVFVSSVRSGNLLATIKWFGRWRCYAMFPEPRTIWNIDCLNEINDKMRSLMEGRKNGSGTSEEEESNQADGQGGTQEAERVGDTAAAQT